MSRCDECLRTLNSNSIGDGFYLHEAYVTGRDGEILHTHCFIKRAVDAIVGRAVLHAIASVKPTMAVDDLWELVKKERIEYGLR